MALPTKESICLPLLKVIADAGGRLTMGEAIRRVEAFFPELTEEDKLQLLPSGKTRRWVNRVQWARQDLVLKGYLDRKTAKGIWQITEQGKEYLESEWPKWESRYPSPEGRKVAKRVWGRREAKEGTLTGEGGTELGTTSLRVHERLKECLYEVGEILGKCPQKEFHERPYIYDVIWRDFPEAPRATHVFEVQDRGNLIEALAKLQHAKDIWGSKPFLIITGEKDRQRLHQLVIPLLSGTFHRLSRELIVLSPEEVEELHDALSKRKEMLKHFLA
ncbi:MAG: winged helix-turn-helix domain-containing protein [Moorellales bacterium]